MVYIIVAYSTGDNLYVGPNGWVKDRIKAIFFTQEQAEAISLTLKSNRPGYEIDYVEY